MSASAVSRLVRIMIASGLLTGLLYLAGETRSLYEPWLLHRKEIAVILAVGVGAVIYLVLLFALRALTLQEIRAALRRSPRSATKSARSSPPPSITATPNRRHATLMRICVC